MEKKEYIVATIDVIEISSNDVVATSGFNECDSYFCTQNRSGY